MRPVRMILGAATLLFLVNASHASTVVGLSIEDQARLARYVVVGEVTAQQGVENPGQGIETAVTFKVSEVLKGEARPGQTLIFHTRGGELGGVFSDAVGEAVFQTGQRALVFIEEVEGRLYCLGLSMGAFNVIEGPTGSMIFTRALQGGLEVVGDAEVEMGPVTFADLANRVAWAARHPQFDNPLLPQARHGGR